MEAALVHESDKMAFHPGWYLEYNLWLSGLCWSRYSVYLSPAEKILGLYGGCSIREYPCDSQCIHFP